jgi:hypothetical protein
MALNGDETIDRVSQAAVQDGAVPAFALDQRTRRVFVAATMGLILFSPILLITSPSDGEMCNVGPTSMCQPAVADSADRPDSLDLKMRHAPDR